MFVVEVMGRQSGWIALNAGLAGGADAVLVPERQVEIEQVCERVRSRVLAGRRFSVVVVAEGVTIAGDMIGPAPERDPAAKHGGVAYDLASELERRTDLETRALVLGHLQRGGTPTAFDRLLATRLGVAALRAVDARRFGQMASLRGDRIKLVLLSEAIADVRQLTSESFELADAILGRDLEGWSVSDPGVGVA